MRRSAPPRRGGNGLARFREVHYRDALPENVMNTRPKVLDYINGLRERKPALFDACGSLRVPVHWALHDDGDPRLTCRSTIAALSLCCTTWW